jgi:hypothetical protein
MEWLIGEDGDDLQDTVLEFQLGSYSAFTDTYNGTWHLRGNTGSSPNPRSGPQFSCFNGRAILYGGRIGNDPQYDIWLYDYNANLWAQTAPAGDFPIVRWFGSSPVRNNQEAFVVMGFNGTWETEDIWSLSLVSSSDGTASSAISSTGTTSTINIRSGIALSLERMSVPGTSYTPRAHATAAMVGQSLFIFGTLSLSILDLLAHPSIDTTIVLVSMLQ